MIQVDYNGNGHGLRICAGCQREAVTCNWNAILDGVTIRPTTVACSAICAQTVATKHAALMKLSGTFYEPAGFPSDDFAKFLDKMLREMSTNAGVRDWSEPFAPPVEKGRDE